MKDREDRFSQLMQQRNDEARKELQDRDAEWQKKFMTLQQTVARGVTQTSVIPDRGSSVVAGVASQQASVSQLDPSRTLRANTRRSSFRSCGRKQ